MISNFNRWKQKIVDIITEILLRILVIFLFFGTLIGAILLIHFAENADDFFYATYLYSLWGIVFGSVLHEQLKELDGRLEVVEFLSFMR